MRYRIAHPPSSYLETANRMPNEKTRHEKNNKPVTPSLSSTFRTNKNQITPKLAGSAPSAPVRPGRNGNRSDPHPSPSILAHNGDIGNASPTLDANVTPRSGARSTKLGGSPVIAGGNQSGTPTASRPVSMIEDHTPSRVRQPSHGTAGLGINDSSDTGSFQSGPISTTGSAIMGILNRRTSVGSNSHLADTAPSKFFHADDAQSVISAASVEEKPHLKKKAATFFYANGSSGAARNSPSPRSTPSPALRRDVPVKPNGAPQRSDPKAYSAPTTRSNLDRRNPSPRLLSPPLAPQQKPPPRPPSPLKSVSFEGVSATSKSQSAVKIKPEAVAPISQTRGEAVPRSPTAHLRKTSLNSTISNTPTGQRKAPSTSSGTTYSRTRTPSLSSNSSPFSAQPPPNVMAVPLTSSPDFSPRAVSFGSSAEMRSSNSDSLMSPRLTPASPTRADHRADLQPQDQLQKMNELAANARRERKVLDLEISNSSLLAINRTLERELRKQAAELRRFRRLSRSGRLSLGADSTKLRRSSIMDVSRDSYSGDDVSQLDSIAESFSDDTESLPSSTLSDSASDSPSQGSRRARDEKRLLLDLSMHQQMLIDSQKMSQSIKRCLTWTEELISEGMKALEYQVRVSEVELGGRVIVREEDCDDGEEAARGTALLSPAAEIERPGEWKFWELSEEPEERREDTEVPPLITDLDGSSSVS